MQPFHIAYMRFFTRLALTALMLATTFAAASAQDTSPSYNFLNISSSTRAYGLGGVNISTIDDDINIVDQNPGLLGSEIGMQLGINYMRYIGDSNFAGVKFGRAAGEHGAWAMGIQYLGYGEIKGADVNGVLTGEFSPKDLVINAMYAHDISSRWRGGINIKYVYSSYDAYSAMALATDLGINYFDPDRDLSFSVVVANLGGQIKRFHESYDRLPIDLRLGWTQSFGTFPVRWSITAWNLTKWHLPYHDAGDGTLNAEPRIRDSFGSNLFRHLIFAADFVPSDKFNIGIGYNYKTRTDMATYQRNFLSGFSVTAGLKVRNFNLGVAFAQPHTGATTLMLNISTNLYEF